MDERRSLLDRVGGDAVVRPAVDLYQRVVHDPELSGYFTGVDVSRLCAHRRVFVTAVLGGSELGSTAEACTAMVNRLVASLRDLGVAK